MNILRLLQTVDRRFLYALLLLAVTVPFFLDIRLPVPISPQTQALYNAIENLPPNSFVLLGSDWSAGTRGENRPQTEAVMRHLMKRKLRFAILAFEAQSATLAQDIATRLQSEYGVKEGVNWVNWGYKVDVVNFLKALVQNVPQTASADVHGTPTAQLPVMQGIHTAKDIALLIDITPSSTYQAYIQFVQGPYQIPMGLAPTAVMAPEAFNYLDSRQLIGMIAGLQGAIEYEQLLGVVGKATRASVSSSFAHLLIIFFILLGNAAMILERRQRARLARLEGQP
ncbi:MAG TPA: hypothetical protein VFB21_26300 [Chthonomonadaceae bacterium]|nr:hypothetical protein [Chthonomonadaceae bacterium]